MNEQERITQLTAEIFNVPRVCVKVEAVLRKTRITIGGQPPAAVYHAMQFITLQQLLGYELLVRFLPTKSKGLRVLMVQGARLVPDL
jgi:hypothetical protein